MLDRRVSFLADMNIFGPVIFDLVLESLASSLRAGMVTNGLMSLDGLTSERETPRFKILVILTEMEALTL